MSYLAEFQKQIEKHDFHKFFQLWEEYVTNDAVDSHELIEVLDLIRESDFSELFGQFADTTIPLWEKITDEEEAYEVIKRIIDLQTTNTPALAEITLSIINNRFKNDPKLKDRIRIVGLRTKDKFKGAISHYELLMHMEKGNFVFHTSGWGTGEIMDCSALREQVSIEFENVTGIKHLTFDNAFKTLIPIQKTHFLARRFADPDAFEVEAKRDAVGVIKLLLKDLGPHTASEIKDELCYLVISETEWTKWWQSTRSKLKKDTMIDYPDSLKMPFMLRTKELSHIKQLNILFSANATPAEKIEQLYTFTRDLPHQAKTNELIDNILSIIKDLEKNPENSMSIKLQIALFKEQFLGDDKELHSLIQSIPTLDSVIEEISIIAFKKRALTISKTLRDDWDAIFLSLLFKTSHTQIRDYILNELLSESTYEKLNEKIQQLLQHPAVDPDLFLWYFQKITQKKETKLPFANQQGRHKFLENFWILLHAIEHNPSYKDSVKKIHHLITNKRFELMRELLENASLEFVQEFLLLVAKSHSLSDADKKNLRSLAQVVHPGLDTNKEKTANTSIFWTTQKGYEKTQARLQEIAEVEMIANAKEVEEARALGDLRENAEYKFACEKRARLQEELKQLGELLNQARILTIEDIDHSTVSIGSIVSLSNNEKQIDYTLLGPWEADIDQQIISYQSQFAQAMTGHKAGDSFTFKETEYTITKIKNIFDK